MVDLNKLNTLLSKTADMLSEKQLKEGNWSYTEGFSAKDPVSFQKEIVITAQNLRTLIQIGDIKSLPAVLKAFYYVSEYDLELKDPAEAWAIKLLGINPFDTPKLKVQKKEILSVLKKTQDNKGYWRYFPKTFNLTNFYVISAMSKYGNNTTLEKAVNWIKKNKAKDKIGWGKDDEAEKSEYSFTSIILLALILAKEDPTQDYIKKAVNLIKSGQATSGGWPSTKFTTTKLTTYATAISTLVLMLTSKNPFNKSVEKGIDFLIKYASEQGGWPLISNDKDIRYYTTFYAINTLSFYRYLKEKLETTEAKNLLKYMEPEQVSAHYYMNFDVNAKDNINNMFLSSFFNSKAIATTSSAIERRRAILKILSEQGPKDMAAVIDELKKDQRYSTLNKKSHMTQIKADIEYLRDIKVVGKVYDLYFVCTNFFNLLI